MGVVVSVLVYVLLPLVVLRTLGFWFRSKGRWSGWKWRLWYVMKGWDPRWKLW